MAPARATAVHQATAARGQAMTVIYGGLILIVIIAGIIYIAAQPKPGRRGRGDGSGSDSGTYAGSGSGHGNDSGSGTDGGSSGGGDGGGGSGGD